ncbi:MAG: hypothetical protein BJ554DRAFT_1650 [Olpidium bornovanus]|uniref:Uncharacterized protein n=1 Tax=Olpidium bornovanus TaxID=278681 RepID=A0A8H7ZS15_9FUNG|nr:MAG: hypothetical protein BJ554DRAFT_1650 [Olpidium bornovanus]
MKTAVLCAFAAAAILTAAPARAVIPIVCQPEVAAFSSVQVSGRGATVENLATPPLPATRTDDHCTTLAGFDFAANASLTINWSNSDGVLNVTTSCDLASSPRCVLSVNELTSTGLLFGGEQTA